MIINKIMINLKMYVNLDVPINIIQYAANLKKHILIYANLIVVMIFFGILASV